ncbi:MAG: GRP family sugar transporter [Candidatus Thermoplasmatota archaeon]|nr:GRP family sugar transporter [Candidatus Thermoplasmatota archaeon]
MGYVPGSSEIALALLVVNMICWGSWANPMKLTGNWRFEAFYWPYGLGMLFFSFIAAMTLGNMGDVDFFTALQSADPIKMVYGVASGFIWNLGNILMVAAIVLAGFSMALPIGVGSSIVIGSTLSYIVEPKGVPTLLFAGVGLISIAIISDAYAYIVRDRKIVSGAVGETKSGGIKASTKRGLIISMITGILFGIFPMFFALSYKQPNGLDAYGTAMFFQIGVFISTLIYMPIFMRKPLTGEKPIGFAEIKRGKPLWFLMGIFSAFIWVIGLTTNLISANKVGVAVAFVLAQCAAMVGACWGIFIWKDFKGAPKRVWVLIVEMFVLFFIGIVYVALASQ